MRILSGLQPSGKLHLGNYFGMMEPALKLQYEGEAFYFIADYHSLTSVHDAKTLREYSQDMAVDFLACGFDPNIATFFRQSDVPEVTELTWLLNCCTPVPMLENAHSYKDKTAHGIVPSAGLLDYPVLMAADILIYDSDVVPVGKDQKQHLEMTRDIAGTFNRRYQGEILKLPKPLIRENTAVVPGVDGQKMSKSYRNTLAIFEEEKSLRKKVMAIKTDSTPVEAPKNPEGSIIIALYQLVATEAEVAQMKRDFEAGGVGYGEFKQRLFEAIWRRFEKERQKRADLIANPDYVAQVLRQGAEKARSVARSVLNRVRQAVGLAPA